MATFRHKSIQRFRIGGFEFKNHLLVLNDEREADRFRRLIQEAGPREASQIVELNEEAMASLETPMNRPQVIRGAQDTGGIAAKPKDSERPVAPGHGQPSLAELADEEAKRQAASQESMERQPTTTNRPAESTEEVQSKIGQGPNKSKAPVFPGKVGNQTAGQA